MLSSRSSRQFTNALTNSLRYASVKIEKNCNATSVHVPGGDLLLHAGPDQDPARVHHQH